MNEELVERVACGLGVWMEIDKHSIVRPWLLAKDVGLVLSRFSTGLRVIVAGADAWVDVDVGTALVLLLGLGRRVDLGECPACRERGGPEEWAVSSTKWGPTGLAYAESRRARAQADGWRAAVVFWETVPYESGDTTHGFYAVVQSRPCPTCTVDGKPTGRRTVTWEQAVLDASPRDYSDEERRILFGCGPLSETVTLGGCGAEVSTNARPGDFETRAALHVLADRLQGDGAPLGTILTAWLRGSCGVCDGSGCTPWPLLDPERKIDPSAIVKTRRRPDGLEEIDDDCPKCHGHGTVLGALADLVRAEAVRVAEAGELAVWRSLESGARTVLDALANGRAWEIDPPESVSWSGADDLLSIGLVRGTSGITPFGRRVAEAGRRESTEQTA